MNTITPYANISDKLKQTEDMVQHIDGLVQERRNSSALAMDLCLSCTDPLISDGNDDYIKWT